VPDGRSRKMRYDTGLGLGRLSMCDLCSYLGWCKCSKRYLLRVPGVLAPFLGLCVLCGGLLLHVLSV
jgi:hypothetical protein